MDLSKKKEKGENTKEKEKFEKKKAASIANVEKEFEAMLADYNKNKLNDENKDLDSPKVSK
jgi:hypothetical protein